MDPGVPGQSRRTHLLDDEPAGRLGGAQQGEAPVRRLADHARVGTVLLEHRLH